MSVIRIEWTVFRPFILSHCRRYHHIALNVASVPSPPFQSGGKQSKSRHLAQALETNHVRASCQMRKPFQRLTARDRPSGSRKRWKNKPSHITPCNLRSSSSFHFMKLDALPHHVYCRLAPRAGGEITLNVLRFCFLKVLLMV
jgi:hypothetical protein